MPLTSAQAQVFADHSCVDEAEIQALGKARQGSDRCYPTPLAEVFRGVPHQLCQFHVVKDIVKAVLGAVSSARKALAALPKASK